MMLEPSGYTVPFYTTLYSMPITKTCGCVFKNVCLQQAEQYGMKLSGVQI